MGMTLLLAGSSGAVTPPDCAALGTCTTCEASYAFTGDTCVDETENVMTQTNCTWAGENTEITCGTQVAGLWNLDIDDAIDACLYTRPLSWCPAGTYTLDTDDCTSGCAATLEVYEA